MIAGPLSVQFEGQNFGRIGRDGAATQDPVDVTAIEHGGLVAVMGASIGAKAQRSAALVQVSEKPPLRVKMSCTLLKPAATLKSPVSRIGRSVSRALTRCKIKAADFSRGL